MIYIMETQAMSLETVLLSYTELSLKVCRFLYSVLIEWLQTTTDWLGGKRRPKRVCYGG